MMVTTHALVGLLVGLALSPLAPTAPLWVAVAGGLGGVVPDLDVRLAHRRTLHLPVIGTLAGLLCVGLAFRTRHAPTVALAAAVLAAGLHALADAVDGGRAVRPWVERPDRGVYCHLQRRWWRPRRLVAYDGSPGDLAVAALLSVILLAWSPSWPIRGATLVLLSVSVGYVALRKRLAATLETVVMADEA